MMSVRLVRHTLFWSDGQFRNMSRASTRHVLSLLSIEVTDKGTARVSV